jgi:hypothetical protein
LASGIKESDRVKLQLAASGRCEMYLRRAGGGRCSGISLEAHHIVKRSLGGGHDPENIAMICVDHHRAVERRMCAPKDWLYLVDVPDDDPWLGSSHAYAESKEGEPCWFLWSEVRGEVWGVAKKSIGLLGQAVEMRKKSGWILLSVLYDMEKAGDLWQMTHNSFAELAHELNLAQSTLRRYLSLGRRIKILPEAYQERLRKYPLSLFSSARIGELQPNDLGDVMEMLSCEVDMADVIEEGQRRVFRASAEKRGRTASEVTLIAKAVTFSVTVEHDEAALNVVELAKRQVASAPIIIRGGVEWGADKQQKVERMPAENGKRRMVQG